MIESQVSKMIDIFHRHVNDHIVASTHQEHLPNLGDGLDLTQKTIDHRSLILGQLDESNRFQVQANGSQIDVRMRAANDSRRLQTLDPFVAGRWREPHGRGDLFVGQPGILLQKTDNLEVCSV